MRRILFFILWMLPFLTSAQKPVKTAEVFCSADYLQQNAVRIKWLYKTVYNPAGFDVYRQEKGAADWIKLNEAPVQMLKVLPVNNKLDKEAKDLHKAVIQMSYEEFSKSLIRAFILIKAIYVDELADYIGISFTDNKVELGKEYQYKVCIAGNSEPEGISKSFLVAPYQKPACPENIKLTRTKKRVDISWKPDIYRYYAVDVYRRKAEDSSFTKITKVPRAIQKDQADKFSDKSIFYDDTAIVYSANYIYRFAAIDYFGQVSQLSPEYSVPMVDFIPPTLPFNIVPTASSLNNVVRLDWQLVDEKDLAGVNIYTSDKPENKYVKINTEVIPKTILTFNHPNAAVGSHYYRIASIDISGNENLSAPVFVEVKDVTPPAKPQGLVSEAAEGAITLKWQANTEKDLRGYHVQRSLKSNSKINSSYVNVTKVPITQITYTEQLSKNIRNEFVYRIVAIDTCFNRSKPSENTLAQMPDVTPPLQPLIKNIIADTLKATVSWLPNVDVDIAGYNLYRALHGDTLVIEKINFNLIPSGLSSYSDRAIKAGISYDYFLEAEDSTGNKSKHSPAFYTKTPEPKVSGSIVIDEKKYNAKKGILKLEWTAQASDEIKGYVVYRQLSKELPFKPVSGLLTDNQFDLNVGEKTNGMIQIKCYTQKGEIISSENFSLISQ